MTKQIKDKITNKITIGLPMDINEDIYDVLKSQNYITDNFKRCHQFNYGLRNYIALYPYKIYENEEEFNEVCVEIQKILIDNVRFTYKYKKDMMVNIYRFPKVPLKRCVVFIEDSD
jgi:hypothetical protein